MQAVRRGKRVGGVTRRNLRKWAEAKQRRAEQAMLTQGRWVYFSDGAGVFLSREQVRDVHYIGWRRWRRRSQCPGQRRGCERNGGRE